MKKKLFFFLLLSLLIPKFQEIFKIFKPRPLTGATSETEKPKFEMDKWFDGSYQNDYSEYKDETFGLRNLLIRLYNQVDYTLFKKSHDNVFIGKNDYLFQYDYIAEITGADFIGDDKMHFIINKLRDVQDYLDKKNIFLMTVLAPGKTDYYKEQIPDYYYKKITTKRNYTSLIKYCSQENIHYIDLNKWVLQMKDTSRYLLFPRQGIHWSYYCMALSADTIVKYIENKTRTKLLDFSWTLETPEKLCGTDYDLGELLNIYNKLTFDKMSYPHFNISVDTLVQRPRLLVIGDSFYWTIFNDGLFKKIFNDETYFYYFKSAFPKEKAFTGYVSDLNIIKEVEKYDIILLIQSSENYKNPGVDFIKIFSKELMKHNLYKKIVNKMIASDKNLLDHTRQLAQKLNISNDSAISILSDSLTEVHFDDISGVKYKMRQSPEWMQHLYEKAYVSKDPIEKVMDDNAIQELEQNKIK